MFDFEQVYREEYRPIRAFFARKHTGTEDEIADITAAFFARIYEKREMFVDQDRGVRPWLFTCANRFLIDYWRSASYRTHISLEKMNHEPGHAEMGDEFHDQLEIGSTLLLAFEALDHSNMQRDAVICRFLRGMSVRETAIHLGIKEESVKKYTFRGLLNMRNYLRRKGVTRAA